MTRLVREKQTLLTMRSKPVLPSSPTRFGHTINDIGGVNETLTGIKQELRMMNGALLSVPAMANEMNVMNRQMSVMSYSVGSTMGFSALDGLPMGTRCGQIDPGVLLYLLIKHLGIIKALEYIDDGRELATISRQTDSAVYFLDAKSGEVKRRFQRHDLCGGDIAVSADGRYLATTSDDASVRFWVLEGDAGEKQYNRSRLQGAPTH